MADTPYIRWLSECDKNWVSDVGGKNASLGEMARAGLRVPPGFAVTTAAYRDFMEGSGLRSEVTKILDQLDHADVNAVEQTSRDIRQMMSRAPIPPAIEDAVCVSYNHLCRQCGVLNLPVAVRSSATAEDLPGASFAGQQDTTLWVRGDTRVLIRTAVCWSSLFTPRAITYRKEMGFPHDKVLISVGIQKMVNAKTAGVMFTLNPINGDRSKIVIDASWGLGESVVSGVVTPDNFMVDKVTFDIIRRTISAKTIEYEPDEETGHVQLRDVPPERQTQPCLSDDEVVNLSKLGKRIEQYYGGPQDIEWAIDRDLPSPDNIGLLQSRPETVWSQKAASTIKGNHATGVEGVLASLLLPVRVRRRT